MNTKPKTITANFIKRDFDTRFYNDKNCAGAKAFKRATNWKVKCSMLISEICIGEKLDTTLSVKAVRLNNKMLNTESFGLKEYDLIKESFWKDPKTKASITFQYPKK